MTSYLFCFGYETPDEMKSNSEVGTDFETSTGVYIEAGSEGEALAWGCEIAEQFMRYEHGGDASISWRALGYAHWIEPNPEACDWKDHLSTFQRVKVGELPDLSRLWLPPPAETNETDRKGDGAPSAPCTVVLVNEFGQVLNRDGSLYRNDSGKACFEQVFSNLESAKEFCAQVVRELPHVACEVVRNKKEVYHLDDPVWYKNNVERRNREFAKAKKRDRIILAAILSVLTAAIMGAIVLWLL